jgi:hypothetical protein
MPNLPWPVHGDEPVTGYPSLAELLAWAEFTPSSAPEMKPVGEVLAALTAGPADDELAGEAAALAAYRSRGGVPRPATRARRRRRHPLFPFPSVRAAATVAAAAAVLSVSAFATAAYTQVLPAPVQQLAHDVIGAPSAGSGPSVPSPAGSGAPSPGGTPTGRAHPSPAPDVTSQSNRPTRQGSGQPSTEPMASDSDAPTPTPTKSKGKPSTHPTPHCNGNGNGNGNDCTPTAQP